MRKICNGLEFENFSKAKMSLASVKRILEPAPWNFHLEQEIGWNAKLDWTVQNSIVKVLEEKVKVEEYRAYYVKRFIRSQPYVYVYITPKHQVRNSNENNEKQIKKLLGIKSRVAVE